MIEMRGGIENSAMLFKDADSRLKTTKELLQPLETLPADAALTEDLRKNLSDAHGALLVVNASLEPLEKQGFGIQTSFRREDYNRLWATLARLENQFGYIYSSPTTAVIVEQTSPPSESSVTPQQSLVSQEKNWVSLGENF